MSSTFTKSISLPSIPQSLLTKYGEGLRRDIENDLKSMLNEITEVDDLRSTINSKVAKLLS